MSQGTPFPTKIHVRPAQTQISLIKFFAGLLKTIWILGYPQCALRKRISDYTDGTCNLVGNTLPRLIYIRVYMCLYWVADTFTLRKHAYSNILKFLQPIKENFQIKTSDIFHIPAQNIDCRYSLEPPRRGVSNEYLQFMGFFRKIRKIMYTPP